MAKKKQDLGEEAISKAVEVGLSAQLNESEDLDVDVEADPMSLMQGEIKAVDLEGKGLVMKEGLRAEELQMETDGISIDPMKAAFGEVKLTRPTEATTIVTLTEDDIERAFNSEFIHQKLRGLEVELNGKPVCVDAQQIHFSLPGKNIVAIATDVTIRDTEETKHLEFEAVPDVGPQGHQVVLEDVVITAGEAPKSWTDGILAAASELLNLRNFELDGMTLTLHQIEIQAGKMILKTKTRLEKLPGS